MHPQQDKNIRTIELKNISKKDIGEKIITYASIEKIEELTLFMERGLFQCILCGALIPQDQCEKTVIRPPICYEEHGGCGREGQRMILMPDDSTYTEKRQIQLYDDGCTLTGELNGSLADDIYNLLGDDYNINTYEIHGTVGIPYTRSTTTKLILYIKKIKLSEKRLPFDIITESMQEKARILLRIIKEKQKDDEKQLVDHKTIITEAVLDGMSREDANEALTKLRINGQIFEPRPKKYRLP